MHSSRYAELKARVQAFHEAYTLHCAGRLRATRDVAMLQQWTDGLERTRREIESDPPHEEHASFLTHLQKRHELYVYEKNAIVQEKQALGQAGCALAFLQENHAWYGHMYDLWKRMLKEGKPSRPHRLLWIQGLLHGVAHEVPVDSALHGRMEQTLAQMQEHLSESLLQAEHADVDMCRMWVEHVITEYHHVCVGFKTGACWPAYMQSLQDEARVCMETFQKHQHNCAHDVLSFMQHAEREIQAWSQDIEEVSRVKSSLAQDEHHAMLETSLDQEMVFLQQVQRSMTPDIMWVWCMRMDALMHEALSTDYSHPGVVMDVCLWGVDLFHTTF